MLTHGYTFALRLAFALHRFNGLSSTEGRLAR
jgi:hypothetical protein